MRIGCWQAFGLVVTIAFTGCTADSSDRSRTASSGVPSPASSDSGTFKPPPAGPFAGMRWPGGPVPTGRLLHDDDRTLFSVKLNGDRHVVWRHGLAEVVAVAAAEDGRRVAMTVDLKPRGPEDESQVLYLLDDGGEITTVDVVYGFRSIQTPVFLRPPTKWKDQEHLYWVRVRDEIRASDGRLDTQVMVHGSEGTYPVTVPLRFGEAVFSLDGYPGAATFTLALYRHNNVPTRLEILKNHDYAGGTRSAGLLLWGENETRAQTDVFHGVAWLSPTDYVVPVARTFFRDRYQLRLFRSNCEFYGSHVLYEGTAIDIGRGPTWSLIGAGRRVLVLAQQDVNQYIKGKTKRIVWHSVSVPDGELASTLVRWQPGPWTWVAPAGDVNPRKDAGCKGFEWEL